MFRRTFATIAAPNARAFCLGLHLLWSELQHLLWAIARPYGKIASPDHPGAQLGSRISAGRARASTESEIAGRNRPKSPILCGSWLGDGGDADAADHRDQNHFRYLMVPPRLLRHQYRHVRPDRWGGVC